MHTVNAVRWGAKQPHGGGEQAHLERRDVGVGDVAVYILDLRQVLLWHVHKLRRAHLIG